MHAAQNMINYTRTNQTKRLCRIESQLSERVSIAHLPSPLEALPRLSKYLGGPELWIKRDDQRDWRLAATRRASWNFVADALRNGHDHLVTHVVRLQSNPLSPNSSSSRSLLAWMQPCAARFGTN